MTDDSEKPLRHAPPPAASLESMGEFIISMIQAFLRTGYYLPDHPESKKAKSGLYDKFSHLTRESGEIAFLLREEAGREIVFLEGLSAAPLKLSSLMTRGMAETYNPRFVHFLGRKELVSLSLKSRMTSEEFSRFIDVMSEPSLSDMREKAAKNEFAAHLKEKGISNLSFVFQEDCLVSRVGVPWRAMLALSRLRKDLRMIPIFRQLKPEELTLVRREILEDILRPLNDPMLVYAFLMNLDLVASRELPEEAAEDEVFMCVQDPVIVALIPTFIEDATGKVKRFHDLIAPGKFSRVLGKLVHRLNALPNTEARRQIEELFNAGLLSLESLPPDVRDRIMTIQLALSFVASRDNYLRHLELTVEDGEYRKRSHLMAKIVPTLIERGRFGDVVLITNLLFSHAREESSRGIIARETLAWLTEGPALELSAEAFLQAPKEDRTDIGRFLALMGELAVPHLLRVLEKTDDQWKRKQAAEILMQIGPAAALSLIDEIERGHIPSWVRATLLRVLRAAGGEKVRAAAVRAVKAQIENQDPEVRLEALAALGRLDATDHFELFKSKVADPDPDMRKTAARCLGLTGDQRAVEPLLGFAQRADSENNDTAWEIAVAALESLAILAEANSGCRAEISRILIGLASQWLPVGGWKSLFGRSVSIPDQALLALADALSRTGGEEAQGALEELASRADKQTAPKIREIIRKGKDKRQHSGPR